MMHNFTNYVQFFIEILFYVVGNAFLCSTNVKTIPYIINLKIRSYVRNCRKSKGYYR